MSLSPVQSLCPAPARPAPSRRRPRGLPAAFAAVLLVAPFVAPRPARAGGQAQAAPAGAHHTRRKVVDRVVAVVNDSIILKSELMTRVAPLTADLQDIADPHERARRRRKLESQVLDQMVNEHLMAEAARKAKIKVTGEDVDHALKEIEKQNKLDPEQFHKALSMQGYTMASYKKDLRRQLLRMRALNMLVRPKVTVTTDDVRAHYNQMSRRSAAVSKVHLEHILISLPKDPSKAQLQAAKARAAMIVKKVRAGAKFGDLARKYSDDEATRADGGDLGWIGRGSIATEWEEIVFGMDKGEVRGPINGPRGLEIFYVAALKKNTIKPFKQVKDKLRQKLYRQAMQHQTQLWLQKLRNEAHVEIKL